MGGGEVMVGGGERTMDGQPGTSNDALLITVNVENILNSFSEESENCRHRFLTVYSFFFCLFFFWLIKDFFLYIFLYYEIRCI